MAAVDDGKDAVVRGPALGYLIVERGEKGDGRSHGGLARSFTVIPDSLMIRAALALRVTMVGYPGL